MNILVCIKQVPDTKDVRLDPETNTMSREGVESIMNPFDRYAVEEAVRIREELGGTRGRRIKFDTATNTVFCRFAGQVGKKYKQLYNSPSD